MKKIFIYLFLMTISFGNAIGQTKDSIYYENLLKQAPYIFRGQVITYDGVEVGENKDLFVVYDIKVVEEYKGKLKSDTIQLINKAPRTWQMVTIDSTRGIMKGEDPHSVWENETFGLSYGAQGIFVCENVENLSGDFESSLKYLTLKPLCPTFSCLFSYGEYGTYIDDEIVSIRELKGFTKSFKQMGTLDPNTRKRIWEEKTVWEKCEQYLEQKGFIKKRKKKDVTFLEKQIEKDNLYKDSIYKQRVDRTQLYEDIIFEKIKKKTINKEHTKSYEEINFEIKNQKITGLSNDYFEFDIFVWANGFGTFLDNAAFVIEYNTIPFGSNVVYNSSIEITKGNNFNSSTYVNPNDVILDDASDAFRFYIGADYLQDIWNRVEITPNKQQLVHVKMKLSNCINTADLQYINTQSTEMVTLYTESSNEDIINGNYFNYDNVNYVQPSTFHLCPPPTIVDFNPKTISSGTNSVLTIMGYGFGNERGSGQIWMKNDRNGSDLIQNFDYIDYIYWSDTIIRLNVPSRIDTLAELKKGSPGSGKFSVVSNNGITSNESDEPLIITHAVNNQIYKKFDYFLKIPQRHNVEIENEPIKFYLDTSISNNILLTATVKQALNDWKCQTKMNWEIVGDTTLSSGIIGDGVSLIYMDENLANDTLGVTIRVTYNLCSDINGNRFFYYDEVDIGFAKYIDGTNDKWHFDSTSNHSVPPGKYDFYTVVLHELGHALGLNHVNQSTDVLFYSSSTGVIRNLQSSPNAVDGGIYIVNQSTISNNCPGVFPITYASTEDCSETGGVINFKEYSGIKFYPNPAEQELTIEILDKSNVIQEIYMLNEVGQVVKNTQGHTNKVTIDISNLVKGFYFVKAITKSGEQTEKIIIK